MASKQITADRINRHAQAIARHMLAYPGTLEEIAELIRVSMKATPADDAEIIRYLRKPATQMLLANHWECGLFATTSGYRLVSFSTPDRPEAARRRLSHRPADPGTQCAFCLVQEKGVGQVIPLFDLYSRELPGVRVHRACARAYKRLLALAEQVEREAPDTKKESLI